MATSCLATRSNDFPGAAETRPGRHGLRGTGTVRQIDPASIRTDAVAVGQSDHGFRRAEEQIPVGLADLLEAAEDVALGRLVEIDQHIATEDDVEFTQQR